MKNKKAISLIVLVITIIVMIILASAIIMSLDNANIMNKAEGAVLVSDAKNLQSELALNLANKKMEDTSFDISEVNEARLENIREYIPSFPDKYYGIFCIKNGELAYVASGVTDEQKNALTNSSITKGSYITKPQADEILSKVSTSGISSDVTTTDITEHVEGIHEDLAEKFVLFQGNLYYRWEKTTYDDRLSLYAAGIPCLMGDATGDGVLSQEDADEICEMEGLGFEPLVGYSSDNLFYATNVSFDSSLDSYDAGIILDSLTGIINYTDYVDGTKHDPDYIAFLGLYYKTNMLEYPKYGTITNANQIKSIVPNITTKEAQKLIIYENSFCCRYEKLTEQERQWCEEFGWKMMLEDGSFHE